MNTDLFRAADKRALLFYLILLGTLAAIFWTHPFLRYPYDMWEHLIGIDEFRLSRLSLQRSIWHSFWRELFALFSIEPKQIFLRAQIIHTAQSLFSFFSIYLFSKVLIRNIYTKIDPLSLRYMAYWSTLIWFTIFATFSMHYHLVWILWYSVTYQITLPMFWYILALTIIILFEPLSWQRKAFYLLQILLLSRIILQMHSMEYFYYLLYIMVLSLLYWRELCGLVRQHYFVITPFVLLILFFAYRYQPEHSQLLLLLQNHDFSQIPKLITAYGGQLQAGANRASAVYNELMTLSLLLGSIMLALLYFRRNEKEFGTINKRMYLFLLLTSLFVLLPLSSIAGGILAIITRINVVHRFYFSASVFLLIPVSIYFFLHYIVKKDTLLILNIVIVSILTLSVLYSKYLSPTHNYANNLHSIAQSFRGEPLAFNLSQEEIKTIGEELKHYKQLYNDGRLIVYFARADIAIVLLLVYREKVFWWGRRANKSLEEFQKELKAKGPADFNTVIFKTPEHFPKYIPFQ